MDKGYYVTSVGNLSFDSSGSQSTIKMDKGYYELRTAMFHPRHILSQSTIKMDKGYYKTYTCVVFGCEVVVAIHNKNGQGLLH